ncbi:MAG: hypothetical protein ACM3TU_01735 [Bacillota bacterium]
MRTALALLVAILSPLLFPAALAFLLVLGASVIVPPAGLLAGVIADGLYHVPSIPLPYATLAGSAASVIGYVVHRFIETRIMGA